MALPTSARVVVVGGGVIGTSTAYHLAKQGCKDVVLVERDSLTSGTTWHAAGLMVTYGSTSETSTEIRKYTKELYRNLHKETGLETGFKACGFIELASNKDYLEEFRRTTAFNRMLGVDVEEIGPEDVKELFPLAKVDDIERGFYVKDDGRVNPVDVTMSLAKGARNRGVRICEGVSVTGVKKKGRAVCGVTTDKGDIECEYVVNCCGMWARQFAARAGVTVPLQAAEHYYLLTEPIPGVKQSWPVIEDPGHYGYYREEGGGLLVGLFEPVCAPWHTRGIPQDASYTQITPDWERVTPFLDKAMRRVPVSSTAGVKQLFCGPESFTPDLAPIVGEAPELRNYFVAAGLNSIGILTGGGMGRVLANWVLTGKPDVDVTYMNITRMNDFQANPAYLEERIVESLGLVYACHYPNRSLKTARNVKHSPLHARLQRHNAYFVDVSGWEGAGWFAPEGVDPKSLAERLTFGRPDYWPQWEAEHKAVRDNVAIIDMSFMAKFRVTGPGAGAALDHISANRVNGAAERITYTQWLDEDGKLQADVTVIKVAEDDFIVVATDTALRHVQAHFRKHAPETVQMVDVSDGLAQINVQGPRSREVLAKVTSADVSHDAFPFRTARHIDVGFARALCTRITYVGELGYELFVPASQADHVAAQLEAAGAEFGIRYAGLKALGSLRLEKGYRDYGHDMDNTDSVIDAGLGMFVSMKKPGGFVGKDAVAAHKASGNAFKHRVVSIQVLDPEPLLCHAEPLRRNGEYAGYVRIASYGHTVGGAVGLAQVTACQGFDTAEGAFFTDGTWTVDVGGKEYPVKVTAEAPYDPSMARIRM
mmetsp:Transcript_46158/g.142286  ORF Transcript_46158/g.142286 Transcript_46158/m.142286 type:complete len:821 (-) Transcript_46158:356-2818(-)